MMEPARAWPTSGPVTDSEKWRSCVVGRAARHDSDGTRVAEAVSSRLSVADLARGTFSAQALSYAGRFDCRGFAAGSLVVAGGHGVFRGGFDQRWRRGRH